ncbi:hypothetical protein K438DRAFT_1997919 [Mycena galopus ATCC 62051]|nr:hypothetical protein K438DRAFT_1997919 [Mycena galopus ATCC 62051]
MILPHHLPALSLSNFPSLATNPSMGQAQQVDATIIKRTYTSKLKLLVTMATRMLPKTHLDAQDFSRLQINLKPFKPFTSNLQVLWFRLAITIQAVQLIQGSMSSGPPRSTNTSSIPALLAIVLLPVMRFIMPSSASLLQLFSCPSALLSLSVATVDQSVPSLFF